MTGDEPKNSEPITELLRQWRAGGNQFYDRLQLFKNIESRWNISGFTKKPSFDGKESEVADR